MYSPGYEIVVVRGSVMPQRQGSRSRAAWLEKWLGACSASFSLNETEMPLEETGQCGRGGGSG